MKLTHNLPKLLPDNDERLFDFLKEIVKHSDPSAEVAINKNSNNRLSVNIKPSLQDFRQDIIRDILYYRKHMHVKAIFSKSLAIEKSINFEIVF